MEGLRQRYEGQVRFLYAYIFEAHPDPEFAPCGPTEDLGWNHPSANTRTMQERAQRTRWLSADFDLNFPWIINPMNDFFRASYGGSSFYSGWVIDCDGTVRVAERWGWATSSTQWCGLPLASATDLTTVLDTYLAHPPPCYRGVVRQTVFTSVVPAVTHDVGVNQTRWETDLSIANPGSDATSVTLDLRMSGQSPPKLSVNLVLGAGEAVELRDVVGTTFETSGSGALWLSSDHPVIAVGRVFNRSPEGSYGQFVRAIPISQSIAGPVAGHLLMLEESTSARTNLGMVNIGDQPVEAEVWVLDSDGAEIGRRTFDLAPYEWRQVNQVLRHFTTDELEGARAAIRCPTPGGAVLAYASVVDNTSGDPTFIEPRLNTYAVDMVLAGTASRPGANNTLWRTDLSLVNLFVAPAVATLELRTLNGNRAGQEKVEISLEPGATVVLRDVVAEFFASDRAGTVTVSGTEGLSAIGRTFNDAEDAGTFGQLVPGIDVTGDRVLRPGMTGHLAQLEESDSEGRRTNLGLVNLSDEQTRVRTIFFDDSGNLLGSLVFQLEPNQSIQVNRILREVTIDEVRNARAEIVIEGSTGRVAVYASSVDNRTGDPVMQLAQP